MSEYVYSKRDDTKNNAVSFNPFVLTCASIAPGEAKKFTDSIVEKNRKLICSAELLYYTGHPEKAHELCSDITDIDSTPEKFAVFLIDALTAMTAGDVEEIMEIYYFVKSLRDYTDSVPQLKKTVDFFSLYFHIMIHNTEDIVLPGVGREAFAVPHELKPIAIFTFAHFLIISGDFERAIGLAESALIMMKDGCTVSEIYLCIIISIGYLSCANIERAEYYIKYAWWLARPDGFIMPFAEYRWMLSGLLEKCIKRDFPDEYKQIAELSLKYHKNWVYVHNSITGDTVSDKLTATEFNIAMLASKEFSNDEIADFLEISVNSVRAHLRNIFNKLGVSSRKELKKYVIK